MKKKSEANIFDSYVEWRRRTVLVTMKIINEATFHSLNCRPCKILLPNAFAEMKFNTRLLFLLTFSFQWLKHKIGLDILSCAQSNLIIKCDIQGELSSFPKPL